MVVYLSESTGMAMGKNNFRYRTDTAENIHKQKKSVKKAVIPMGRMVCVFEGFRFLIE